VIALLTAVAFAQAVRGGEIDDGRFVPLGIVQRATTP
jgi:hypothetical protein